MSENDTAVLYNPFNWYWQRSDGALFSSARIAIVAPGDADYIAWAAPGRVPTPWPRNTAGQETVAELQDVLGRHGLFASLEAYTAGVRYETEIAGVLATVGGDVVLVSTARDNRDGMRDTMLAILTGLRSDGSTLKIFADGVPRPATNDEAAAAVAAAFGHVQAAFDKEGEVVAGIAAGTVKTKGDVESAFTP